MSLRLGPGLFHGRTIRKAAIADLILTHVRYTDGARRHQHERAYFCLIRDGVYDETYARRARTCRSGMLVYHPPGESHAQTVRTPTVAALNVELGSEWLRRMREYGMPLDQPAESQDQATVGLAERLLESLRGLPGDGPLAIESLTAEILSAVVGRARPRDRRMPKWLRDVQDLVDADVTRTPSLGALAAAVGVHPVYLAETFRRFRGCSVGEYARRRRLELARHQLSERHRPLSQIAAEAGFADQSHFTRTFKRFTGLTPRQYRTFLAFKIR